MKKTYVNCFCFCFFMISDKKLLEGFVRELGLFDKGARQKTSIIDGMSAKTLRSPKVGVVIYKEGNFSENYIHLERKK